MKTILTLTALFAVSTMVFGSAYALEPNNEYILDDSEYISILVTVDDNGEMIFDEVFITPEGGDREYVMTADTAKEVRIYDDHSKGMIFGKTLENEYILVLFEIDGDDVKLKAKVWAWDGKERIISDGEVIPIF